MPTTVIEAPGRVWTRRLSARRVVSAALMGRRDRRQRVRTAWLRDHRLDPEAAGRRRPAWSSPRDSVFVDWPFEDSCISGTTTRPGTRDGFDRANVAMERSLEVEVGLNYQSDWTAVPVATAVAEVPAERPSAFVATSRCERAGPGPSLRAALGVYTVECNGSPIGDDVLAPRVDELQPPSPISDVRRHRRLLRGPEMRSGVTVAEGGTAAPGFRGGARGLRRRDRSG